MKHQFIAVAAILAAIPFGTSMAHAAAPKPHVALQVTGTRATRVTFRMPSGGQMTLTLPPTVKLLHVAPGAVVTPAPADPNGGTDPNGGIHPLTQMINITTPANGTTEPLQTYVNFSYSYSGMGSFSDNYTAKFASGGTSFTADTYSCNSPLGQCGVGGHTFQHYFATGGKTYTFTVREDGGTQSPAIIFYT